MVSWRFGSSRCSASVPAAVREAARRGTAASRALRGLRGRSAGLPMRTGGALRRCSRMGGTRSCRIGPPPGSGGFGRQPRQRRRPVTASFGPWPARDRCPREGTLTAARRHRSANGIPVTTVARTLVDLGDVANRAHVEHRRRASRGAAPVRPARSGGRDETRGESTRQEPPFLSATDLAGGTLTASELEETFLEIVRTIGLLTPRSTRTMTLPDGTPVRIDFLWRAAAARGRNRRPHLSPHETVARARRPQGPASAARRLRAAPLHRPPGRARHGWVRDARCSR